MEKPFDFFVPLLTESANAFLIIRGHAITYDGLCQLLQRNFPVSNNRQSHMFCCVKLGNLNVDELDRGILECGFRSSREICIACADPDDQICTPADDIGSGCPGDSHRTEVLGVIVGQRSFSSLCLRYGNSCLLDKLGEGCGGL